MPRRICPKQRIRRARNLTTTYTHSPALATFSLPTRQGSWDTHSHHSAGTDLVAPAIM